VLDLIGDRGLRETLLLVRGRPGATSIQEVAEATGVHRNVARRRLERLTAAGLLTAHFERPPGRTGPGAGRPAKVYAPVPETSTIEFPERRYPELVGLLVGALPKHRLSEIGARFGTSLAAAAGVRPVDDPRAGLEALCEAMGAFGFQTRLVGLENGHAEIATPTCPLRPLVVADPAVAVLDDGVWRGLVASAIEGVAAADVGCAIHDCLEPCSSCRIVLTLPHPGT